MIHNWSGEACNDPGGLPPLPSVAPRSPHHILEPVNPTPHTLTPLCRTQVTMSDLESIDGTDGGASTDGSMASVDMRDNPAYEPGGTGRRAGKQVSQERAFRVDRRFRV